MMNQSPRHQGFMWEFVFETLAGLADTPLWFVVPIFFVVLCISVLVANILRSEAMR